MILNRARLKPYLTVQRVPQLPRWRLPEFTGLKAALLAPLPRLQFHRHCHPLFLRRHGIHRWRPSLARPRCRRRSLRRISCTSRPSQQALCKALAMTLMVRCSAVHLTKRHCFDLLLCLIFTQRRRSQRHPASAPPSRDCFRRRPAHPVAARLCRVDLRQWAWVHRLHTD
jgi:hypothetical protein